MAITENIARLLFSLGLNGVAAVSFRNRLVNGGLAINQRAAPDSPAVYEPGAFIRDRWRAGPAGCTAACKIASNGDTTLHIGAGSVIQAIEGGLYLPEGGSYCLSWQGTAVGRIAAPGSLAAFSVGPAITCGLAPGADIAVEFGIPAEAMPVSLRLIQLEPGSTPTLFERRDDELRRCQRYFIRLVDPPLRGVVCENFAGRCGMPLPVKMRSIPTAFISGALQIFDGTDIVAVNEIVNNYSTADWVEVDFRLNSPLHFGRPAVIFVSGQSGALDLSAELELR